MSQPVAVDILSDDDDDDITGNQNHTVDEFTSIRNDAVLDFSGNRNDDVYDFPGKRNDAVDLSTPVTIPSKKKRKTESNWNPTVFIIDDDPTPSKPSRCSTNTPSKPSRCSTNTPSFVADTPISEFSKTSDVSVVKCSVASSSKLGSNSSSIDLTPCMVAETPASELPKYGVPIVRCSKAAGDSQRFSSSILDDKKDGGFDGAICLESDNESEDSSKLGAWKKNEKSHFAEAIVEEPELGSRVLDFTSSPGDANFMRIPEGVSPHQNSIEDDPYLDLSHPDEEIDILEHANEDSRPKGIGKVEKSNRIGRDEAAGKKRMSKEELLRLKEEKKQQKEQEKLQREAQKAEAAEIKKLQKEKQKWEKGKFAQKSIVAQIDTRVVELGSIGGHLLTRFAEKGLSYRITSNPIERSIVWGMSVPEEISQISSEAVEIPYVLIIYEAEEFCNVVNGDSFLSHVCRTQRLYPLHTICYLTNKLMAYINKREQGQYKDPANRTGWKRPPIQEVLSKLTTNFVRVHSRHCVDEAELAEHVVGLTCSLASCQFRNKLTRLSVNANGSLIPKDCVDKNLIKKSTWLKGLVAIPKVQPRFAIAIWKKYPTMKSLLRVYMDPSKSVHEKEFLLKDLRVEGLLGDDRRLGEVCSKRVYRILMAQCGHIKTDDIECGADFFSQQSAE